MTALPREGRAEYQSKGKRDPFIPLLTEGGQRIHPSGYDEQVPTGVAGLALQGIVYEKGGASYALINGEVVREGEEVEGVKVLKIDADAVTIQAEEQTHRLVIQPMEEMPQAKKKSKKGEGTMGEEGAVTP